MRVIFIMQIGMNMIIEGETLNNDRRCGYDRPIYSTDIPTIE